MPLHKIDYFCAKLQKSVESLIVPIAVALIIFLIEKSTEKKNASKGASNGLVGAVKAPKEQRPKRTVHVSPSPRVATEPKAAPEHAATISPTALPEEGVRVTADKPMAAPVVQARRVPPVPGGDLRKAIIWSEILRRKF